MNVYLKKDTKYSKNYYEKEYLQVPSPNGDMAVVQNSILFLPASVWEIN